MAQRARLPPASILIAAAAAAAARTPTEGGWCVVELRSQDIERGEHEVVGGEVCWLEGGEAGGASGAVRECITHAGVCAYAQGVGGHVARGLGAPLTKDGLPADETCCKVGERRPWKM